MSASRTTQELDVVLRSIDSMIRSTSAGVTAKMTPPNDPQEAGLLRVRRERPRRRPGRGHRRLPWPSPPRPPKARSSPAGSTSRDRRVKPDPPRRSTSRSSRSDQQPGRRGDLLPPQRQPLPPGLPRRPRAGEVAHSGSAHWTSNGISTRCSARTPQRELAGDERHLLPPVGIHRTTRIPPAIPIPNDLGDLTNRENRAFRPGSQRLSRPPPARGPTGIPDDGNGDGTTITTRRSTTTAGLQLLINGGRLGTEQVHEVLAYPTIRPGLSGSTTGSYDVYAFPFIYPGMYSVPDPSPAQPDQLGWRALLFPNRRRQTQPLAPGDRRQRRRPRSPRPAQARPGGASRPGARRWPGQQRQRTWAGPTRSSSSTRAATVTRSRSGSGLSRPTQNFPASSSPTSSPRSTCPAPRIHRSPSTGPARRASWPTRC